MLPEAIQTIIQVVTALSLGFLTLLVILLATTNGEKVD